MLCINNQMSVFDDLAMILNNLHPPPPLMQFKTVLGGNYCVTREI